MLAILKYPKEQKRRGRISPYFARLKIQSKRYIVLEGTHEDLLQLKEVVIKNGGRIVFPVKIIIGEQN